MAWFSILPASLEFIEIWIVRLFLLLGIIAIGPWTLLIIYDLVLYIIRTATYEIPYVGGKARNRPRPRAPSLSERPSGKPRSFSLTGPVGTAVDEAVDGLKKRSERPHLERGTSETITEDE